MLSQGTQWLSRRGYRLSEKTTVNDGDGTNRDLGHKPGHDPDDSVQSVDEDTFNARQKWILEQLESVEGIRIGDVTAAFGSSNSTAKRDITELREEGMIVFEGKSRTGFYRQV